MDADKFELIIFDCDGVLVDSEPLVNRAFVEALAMEEVHADPDQFLTRFTGASLSLRIAATSAEFDWVPSAHFVHEFERRLTDYVRHELRAVPGVSEIITALRVRRCVASNGTLAEMTARLAQVQLLELFVPHLFSAADRPRPKPFPDVYLYAASIMGVGPRYCAVIEDSIPGVQAGIAAGMTVFAYAPNQRSESIAGLGATVFTSMTELPRLLLVQDSGAIPHGGLTRRCS